VKTIRFLDGPYAGTTREVHDSCDYIVLGRGPRTPENLGSTYMPITMDDPESPWWLV
jgi:hypothetical protein